MTDELLRQMLLHRSFFDRVAVLAREYDEKRLPLEMFAERVQKMSVDFDKAINPPPKA